ncbi:MAG: NUDIX domain-containing protein [Micrococcales bacterium]|nr:NUDIX domain-containing protein [Micrococcales bacterium]
MRMPPELLERARAMVYGGQWSAPDPRPAATLVLLRDGAAGIEVALLQRSAHLGFARGMYVFPGGALDAADADLGDPWLVAAIRETFEECGVLLAEPDPHGDVQGLRERDFAEALGELGARPAVAALHTFAHWVTPEIESRRFDTRFYAAALPPGQDLMALTSEHQAVGWYRPQDATALPMLPPTAAALAEVARFATVAEVLEVQRRPVPIMPRPVAAGEDDIAWILVNAVTGEAL